ncbi:MAG: hypothetical protein ABSE99_00410 [Terracidiphilus sp.]
MGSQDTGTPSPKAESDESVGEHGQPIIVTLPATPPAPWTLREKISWGASLVLVILGYAGVMLALRTLKIIQRQTESNEAAAQAALDSAHAALLNAQSIIGAERPWLLISIEPFLTMENCFKVMVTNRGRTPARIVALADRMRIAKDETHLPASPAYDGEESGGRPVPIILLPGESTGIRRVSRDDVKRMCKSDESLRRVEQWEDKLFVYGKVTYRDLIAPADKQIHETDWCCWFIYREAQCNLVSAGPPDYNRHT